MPLRFYFKLKALNLKLPTQVPDRLKKQTGPGSPMWIYVKFRSYMEEVAPT